MSTPTFSQVRSAMARLDRCASPGELMVRLVEEAAQIAPRVALFVQQQGNCVGWYGQGFAGRDFLRSVSVPPVADTVLRAVLQSGQSFVGASGSHRDNYRLLARLGRAVPAHIFAMPLVMGSNPPAVLYADSGDGREVLGGAEAIEILGLYACRTCEALSAARPPAPTPSVGKATLVPIAPPRPVTDEDARRLARLLVSEIKLYNEADVERGRKNGDLYHLLQYDIERSHQYYVDRIPATVRARGNFFEEELVRVLAEGDAEALQIPWMRPGRPGRPPTLSR
jgi:hypothetical protein